MGSGHGGGPSQPTAWAEGQPGGAVREGQNPGLAFLLVAMLANPDSHRLPVQVRPPSHPYPQG